MLNGRTLAAMALNADVEERDRRTRTADLGDQAFPGGDAFDVLGEAARDLSQLTLTRVDAGHAAHAGHALLVERVRLNTGYAVSLEHVFDMSAQDGPIGRHAPSQPFVLR